MRSLRSGSLTRVSAWWLAAGAIGIALLAGGIGYGLAHVSTTSLLDELTSRRASPQEVAATRQPQTAGPQGQAAAPQGQAAPAGANSARPTGVVTEISADPGSF